MNKTRKSILSPLTKIHCDQCDGYDGGLSDRYFHISILVLSYF